MNLRAALDQCSVKEPDLELVSADGRRVFGHRLDALSQVLMCFSVDKMLNVLNPLSGQVSTWDLFPLVGRPVLAHTMLPGG